jgi:cytochrome b6-f complex iron-sulfur subunit
MDRKEFLSLVGVSAGGVLLASCLGGCAKENAVPLNINFTLDLNESANAPLRANGGFVARQGVIVARTNAGDFIAVAAACTHQGTTVQYQAGNSRFFCPNHGSTFTESGQVINGPANRPLQRFNTELIGDILRIFS